MWLKFIHWLMAMFKPKTAKTYYSFWSQKDPRWGELTIGKTKFKLKDYGCYVVSLAMLLKERPDTLLKLLNSKGCFNSEGALDNFAAANAIKRRYTYSHSDPKKLCIMETDYYKKKGYPQHFVLWLAENNEIVDPLTGEQIVCKYPAVSFRLFEEA